MYCVRVKIRKATKVNQVAWMYFPDQLYQHGEGNFLMSYVLLIEHALGILSIELHVLEY